MGYVSKERGRYRARYRDPLGSVQSKTFTRKADAEKFVLQVESEKLRGDWLDPRDADMPVALWAETFPSLCRRLSPTTQETYRRDPQPVRAAAVRFVPPRAALRLTRSRTGSTTRSPRASRHLFGSSALPNAAAHARGRGPEAEDPRQPVRHESTLPVSPKREMDVPRATGRRRSVSPRRTTSGTKTLIYVAVDSGMRSSETSSVCAKARSTSSHRKVRVTEQLVQLEELGSWLRKEPKTSGGRSFDHAGRRSPRHGSVRRTSLLHADGGADALVFANAERVTPLVGVELPDAPLLQSAARSVE